MFEAPSGGRRKGCLDLVAVLEIVAAVAAGIVLAAAVIYTAGFFTSNP
jgi:hypothetical protein